MAETEPAPVEVPQTEEPAPVIEDATAVEDGAAGTKRKLDDVEPTGEEDPHIAKRPSFNGPEATENGVEVRAREIRGPAASPLRFLTLPRDLLILDLMQRIIGSHRPFQGHPPGAFCTSPLAPA
jgi:hypothetical protein